MFGVANQLLAVVALAVGDDADHQHRAAQRYAWVTLLPLVLRRR